jgi:carbonic anhydrase
VKIALASTLLTFAFAVPHAPAAPAGNLAPDAALQRLKAGNARFVAGDPAHPNQSPARRKAVAKGQKPFAAIVACSDSRCAPEQIFDQGIGDLFVTRLAGNIVDDAAIGSLEFAVAKLGARAIVVLGHEACGAVDASVQGAKPPGKIPAVLKAIRPAAKAASGMPGNTLDNAIALNVHAQVRKLATSDVLRPMIKDGSLSIRAATYDLDTGKVKFLD